MTRNLRNEKYDTHFLGRVSLKKDQLNTPTPITHNRIQWYEVEILDLTDGTAFYNLLFHLGTQMVPFVHLEAAPRHYSDPRFPKPKATSTMPPSRTDIELLFVFTNDFFCA